jgi:hypothetical protein
LAGREGLDRLEGDVVLAGDVEGGEREQGSHARRLILDADLVLLAGFGCQGLARYEIEGGGREERFRVAEIGGNTTWREIEGARSPGECLVLSFGGGVVEPVVGFILRKVVAPAQGDDPPVKDLGLLLQVDAGLTERDVGVAKPRMASQSKRVWAPYTLPLTPAV